MNLLKKARDALAALQAKLAPLLAKEEATAEELAALKALTEDIKKQKALIADLEAAEAAAAEDAVDAEGDTTVVPANKDNLPATIPATAARSGVLQLTRKQADAVNKVGLLFIATAMVKAGLANSVGDVFDEQGYTLVKNDIIAMTPPDQRGRMIRSLQVGSAISGGILVPAPMQNEIIELLRPQTAFLAGNPRNVPMPNGTFNQAGGATGAQAQYGGELVNAAVTEPTFRDIVMAVKELKALVPMSNQFLEFSIPAAREFVESDLRSALSEKMDNSAFLGDGLQARPLGLYNIPGIFSTAAVNSTTPTMANIDSDARKLLNALTGVNINLSTAKWVMSRRIAGYIADLRDGNGNFAFPTMQGETGLTFKGLPVLLTTNLPENLGGGSNEGYISLIAWTHVLFGDQKGLSVAVSTEAAYYDAGGVVRSAFQRGETLLLALMRHDFNLRHVRAVAVLTAVKWGG